MFDGDRVAQFTEKPQIGEGWINGGFFVFEPEVFDYIDGDDDAASRREPLERLADGRPAHGVPPRGLLAVHGHAARRAVPAVHLGDRQRPWVTW